LAKHRFAINDREYEVEVGARQGSRVQVTVNGKSYEVELKANAAPATAKPQRPASPLQPSVSAPLPAAATAVPGGAADNAVRAPMAGLVLSVRVKVGDQVNAGDELLMLEAMKMENAITAERAGTVKRVAVEPQQVVNQDDVLIELG
jgi:glutaconyl-CoA decarboxylase